MNKDVIYIEPEYDITDILSKIKNSKTKIVALVPPKKAGVLHSAVNFKLITKVAVQNGKTIVLISTDEALLKLAAAVNMPVAKNLQTKPELVDANNIDESEEDEPADDNVIEDDTPTKTDNTDDDEKSVHKIAVHKDDDAPQSKPASRAHQTEEVELDDDDISDDDKKRKKTKVPNFKKYQKQIIAGVIAVILIIGFCFWALVIAPAAKITVSIKTSENNFSESVKFTTKEDGADAENGTFYMEEKSIEKTASADFVATGEVDKGTKAGGKLTLSRTNPVILSGSSTDSATANEITIPSGSKFSYNGLTFVSTAAVALRSVTTKDVDLTNCKIFTSALSCNLTTAITTSVSVVAAENGDKYNIAAATSGWTDPGSGYNVTESSAMIGGTSKMVKVVSQEDIDKAEATLDTSSESEARSDLSSQFGKDYLLISSSFNADGGQVTSSPALNEEVGDGVTPKVVKKTTYKIFAVESAEAEKFIKAKVTASLGDDTQEIYSTGISSESDKNKAFFESFKSSDNTYTAKLKSTVKTGPRVTEAMVSEKSLGKKIGEVKTMLKSINGVSDVKIDTSFFWVTSIPSDPNKLTIELKVE